MNILKVLHKEERKLTAASGKIEGELTRIRAAINALASNGTEEKHRRDVDPRRGRKLSAANRRAMKAGIARAKARAKKAA
jgi:hypothetical protein